MSTFQLNKKVKYFSAAVDDALPYIKGHRSYLKDQLEGKKFGQSYTFYIPDPGVATVGTTDLDISSMIKSTYERPVTATIVDGKAAVELTAWEKMNDIESFVREIANPRGRRLAAEIEADVIKNAWKVSDGAIVVPAASFGIGIFQSIASRLRGVKVAGKKIGYAHPTVFGDAATKFLANFVPSPIQSKIYNDVYLGRYAGCEWIEENFMPVVSVGALPTITSATMDSDGLITVTGTNLVEGAMFFAANAAGSYFHTVDLNCMAVPLEKFAFIVDKVSSSTSATLAGHFRFYTKNGVAQTNPSIYGEETDLAGATWTCQLEAGKEYRIMQVRDNDQLEWDISKFPDLEGCKNETQSTGSVTIQACSWGDVKTRNSVMRLDLPYVACAVDGRLSRVAYCEI